MRSEVEEGKAQKYLIPLFPYAGNLFSHQACACCGPGCYTPSQEILLYFQYILLILESFSESINYTCRRPNNNLLRSHISSLGLERSYDGFSSHLEPLPPPKVHLTCPRKGSSHLSNSLPTIKTIVETEIKTAAFSCGHAARRQ